MKRRTPVLVAAVFAAWWAWPTDGQATETGTELRVLRRAPDSAKTVRTWTGSVPVEAQEPAEQSRFELLEPPPVLTTVHLYVSTEDEEAVPSAFVSSEDCGMSTLVMDGYASLALEPGQACTFVASRVDGLLSVESEASETIELVAGDEPEVELFLPGGRIGGLGVAVVEHPHGIEIVRVHPGSPAEDLELLAGDLIVEVEGIPAIELDLAAFVRELTGPEGSPAVIVVAWEDERGWMEEVIGFDRGYIEATAP